MGMEKVAKYTFNAEVNASHWLVEMHGKQLNVFERRTKIKIEFDMDAIYEKNGLEYQMHYICFMIH